jgi:hypothetical protein
MPSRFPVALLWLVFCLVIAVAAELGRPGGADLIGPTFSELIFTDRGARLVGAAMLAAAFAVASVSRTLLDAGAPVDRPATILLGGWVTTMAIAAVVPMTPVGAPFAWHDSVHRWVALAGLLCLPLAGLRLSRALTSTSASAAPPGLATESASGDVTTIESASGLTTPPGALIESATGSGIRGRAPAAAIRWTCRGALVSLAAFVLVSLAGEESGLYAYRGITERVTLAADLLLIGLLAATPLLTGPGKDRHGKDRHGKDRPGKDRPGEDRRRARRGDVRGARLTDAEQ